LTEFQNYPPDATAGMCFDDNDNVSTITRSTTPPPPSKFYMAVKCQVQILTFTLQNYNDLCTWCRYALHTPHHRGFLNSYSCKLHRTRQSENLNDWRAWTNDHIPSGIRTHDARIRRV